MKRNFLTKIRRVVLGILLTFEVTVMGMNFFFGARWAQFWGVSFSISVVLYIAIRFLIYKTRGPEPQNPHLPYIIS